MEKQPVTKRKKYVQIIILMFILIGALVPILSIIDEHYNWFGLLGSKAHTELIISDTDTAFAPANGLDMDEERGDYEEEGEESNEEEISTYSLASLWDKPEDDEKNIQDLIFFYMDRFLPLDGQGSLEHINQYNGFCKYLEMATNETDKELLKVDDQDDDDKYEILFSNTVKIAHKINRDPNKIKSVFYTYKNLLYTSLSKKNYFKADLNNYVDILILSYKDIHSSTNSKNVLMELYEITELNNNEEYYKKFVSIKKIVSEDYKKIYANIYFGNGSKIREEDLFWAYSFWVRRDQEKSVTEIFDILTEIQNHYSE